MRENKKIMTIEEIENEELKRNITTLNGMILQFFMHVRNFVESKYRSFNTSPENLTFTIIRTDDYDFANDGNTKVDGYDYDIYWVLPFTMNINEEPNYYKNLNLYGLEKGFLEKCLFFKYSVTERVSDGRIRSPFVELFYSRPKRTCFDTDATSRGYHVADNNIIKIDHNNDNYPLTSIINVKNAAECIELISTDVARNELMNSIIYHNEKGMSNATPINE